eukprot:TRINITY_DN6484_c0_g1_i2.p1 TRINITY_DN6484_c0_g1~~TRINITY_DN6484_c0_g1_i2.p1  ORF type:complete len:286 (-),score=52.10 TRINITY_DN6484_c0_g1_i2:8-865(-)
MNRLKGKVAIVTGAGGAIGEDIATKFAEEGANVCVVDFSDRGADVAASISGRGLSAMFCKCDISSEESVKSMVDAVVTKWSTIDILVNCAVAFVFGTVQEATVEDWDRVLGVNVKGTALCTKHAVAPMIAYVSFFAVFMRFVHFVVPNSPLLTILVLYCRAGKGGSIINVGSISSFISQPAFVPYNTSKGAILQLTRCCAYDLGKHGIRVNTVCPGCIDTPATDLHAKKLGKQKDELCAEMIEQHIIKRMGTSRDIANACVFLAGDESTFMTGTELVVDGGYLAH